MTRIPILIGAGIVLCSATTGCHARKSSPRMITIQAYQQALERSTDPVDRATLAEIDNGPADLAREEAAAIADGIPVTSRNVAPPASENAAPLYKEWQALALQRKAEMPIYASPLGIGYAYTPDQIAKVQTIISSNTGVFDMMHRAIDMPEVYLPRNPKGMQDFSILAAVRDAARVVNTESLLLAKHGHYSEAIAMQARGLRIERQLNYNPDLLQYLVGSGTESIAMTGCRNIMYVAGPNMVVDRQVRQAITSNLPALSLKHALTGELPEALAEVNELRSAPPTKLYEAVQSMDSDDNSEPSESSEAHFTPAEDAFVGLMVDAIQARIIAELRTLIAVADKANMLRRAVLAQPAALPLSSSAASRQASYFQHLADRFVPPDGAELGVNYIRDSLEQETLAMAAVLESKAQTGRFPGSLPDGFIDLFDGKSLGYRLEGGSGFVIYSVGLSGHFGGGKPGEKPNNREYPVRYPAPRPVTVPAGMLP